MLYPSATTVAELRFGVEKLPVGSRRDHLPDHLEPQELPMFAGRVLAFDLSASLPQAPLDGRLP